MRPVGTEPNLERQNHVSVSKSESAPATTSKDSPAPATAKESRKTSVATLMVKNLPKDASEAELRDGVFGGFIDHILSLRIPRDEDGQRRDVAYVDFLSYEQFELAMWQLDGMRFGGKELVMENCRSPTPIAMGKKRSSETTEWDEQRGMSVESTSHLGDSAIRGSSQWEASWRTDTGQSRDR